MRRHIRLASEAAPQPNTQPTVQKYDYWRFGRCSGLTGISSSKALQRARCRAEFVVVNLARWIARGVPLCARTCVLFGLSISSSAVAQGEVTMFDAADLFYLEASSDPQISPDGSQVAYVRRSANIMSDVIRTTIWIVNTRTRNQMPIATGAGSHTLPRWSPDGQRLAYVASPEGGPAQLFVHWLNNGNAVPITSSPEPPTSIGWSPNGESIAYTMAVAATPPALVRLPSRPHGAKWAPAVETYTGVTHKTDESGYLKPRYSHLFVVPANGGASRQLSFGRFHDRGPLSWTPDGRFILFSGNRTAGWEREALNDEVYQLEVSTGVVTALTSRKGPDQAPAASPDGQFIAYTGFDDDARAYHVAQLYVLDRATGVPRSLTGELDRSVENPTWAADSRSIYVQYDDRGVRKVARVSMDGQLSVLIEGLAGPILDRPYTGGTFTVSREGSVAATTGDALRPPDVSLFRRGVLKRLTELNAELLAGKKLATVRKISTISFDGRLIEGWLTLPSDYREGLPSPLILEIHGGPRAAYGPYFSYDNQLYAAAGFIVLSANPRGSTSYGDEFANLIHRNYPGDDYRDLMAIVDAAVAQGFADPERLFVTGGSGGGILTAWITGKTQRFRAAAVQKPMINMISAALTADQPAFYSRYWFGKYPWEDPMTFWARSPLSLVGNVTTPTLLIVGTHDFRTPVSEAEQFYTALQLRGVPTALIRVPGANHAGLSARPSHAAARLSATISWFQRHDTGAEGARFRDEAPGD